MLTVDRWKLALFSVAALVGSGCGGGDDGPTSPGTAQDGGADTASSVDAGDSGPDVASPDAGLDADATAPPDAALDTADEPEPDAAPDVVEADVVEDVEADALPEAGDASPETGVCTPGDAVCDGNTPRICDGTGNWVQQAPCLGAAPVCLNGDCVACAPGAATCADTTTLQTCDAAGSWQISTCPYVCQNGTCVGSCVPGTADCDGNVPRSCDANGQWVSGSACPFVCSNGACTGVCTPGSKQCFGNTVQLCTAQGHWQNDEVCAYVCSSGACVGACTPGSKQCSGNSVQTCQANGTWLDTQTCPYVCSGGTCTGVCTPGSTQCSGTSVQTCDGTGQWQTTQTCPYVCSSGVCTGACVPGTNRCSGTTLQLCDGTGTWQNLQSCPYACLNNACTDCQPGAVGCNGLVAQQCSTTTGQWVDVQTCPYVCSGGACIGTCTPGATQCVGSDLQLCDGSGTWQDSQTCPYACINGACTGVCVPGTKQCSGTLSQTCTAQGQWSSVQCPTPPGAAATCTGEGVCGFACNVGQEDCNGEDADGCEAALGTDGLNCGYCGHDCGGGACEAGKCQPVTLVDGLDYPGAIAVDHNYVYFSSDQALRRVAKSGGAAQTLYSNVILTYRNLILDGSAMYWTPDSGAQYAPDLVRGPTGGGPTEKLVTLVSQPNGLSQDGDFVYYNHNQVGNVRIYRRSKTTSALTQLVSVSATPVQIVFMTVSDGFVWWTGGADNHIHKTPTAGGATTNHTSFAAKTYAITSDADYVYWVAAAFSTYQRAVWRSAKSGIPTPTVVVQGGANMTTNDLLVDDENVYLARTCCPMGIARAPKSGGTLEALPVNELPMQSTQDDGFIYWTVSAASPNGAVRRIAK